MRLAAADLPAERGLGFEASVPVQEVVLTNPDVADLPPEASAVIGEKVTSRIAQRPGA